jgi:hypothetical protein
MWKLYSVPCDSALNKFYCILFSESTSVKFIVFWPVEDSVKMDGICEPFAIFLSLKQFDHMLQFLWRHGSLVNRIHYSTTKTKTKQNKTKKKENRHPFKLKM